VVRDDVRAEHPQPPLRRAVPRGVRMTVEAPERTDERFPDDDEFQRYLGGRTRRAGVSRALFLAVLFVTIGALATLIYTIVNDAFGLTAVVNERDPDAIVASLGHDP